MLRQTIYDLDMAGDALAEKLLRRINPFAAVAAK